MEDNKSAVVPDWNGQVLSGKKKEIFFCPILDTFTCLPPYLLQQHGEVGHESEDAPIPDGALGHRRDAEYLHSSWLGGCCG